MREDIKERIDLIKKGKVPEGYKKTKLGIIPEDWNIVQIKDVLKKIDNPVQVEDEQEYIQIGIRSHGKGIFYKEPVTGRELGNKRVFWVEPDCFVVNIVFAWEQAIFRTTKADIGMIASHRFPMYKPIQNRIDIVYLVNYFMTAKGKDILEHASPGGAGRNRTLGQERFVKSKIVCPTIKEQGRINTLIETLNREIKLTEMLIKNKKQLSKYVLKKELELGSQERKKTFNEVFTVVSSNNHKIEAGEYLEYGKIPVVDQGKNKVAGFCNDESKKVVCPSEGIIVFGDHTRIIKYVTEDFVVGADGVQLLVSKQPQKYLTSYLYFFLKIIDLPDGGYCRHFKYLKEKQYCIPDMDKQKAIVTMMLVFEKEIILLERKLELLKKEKEALMRLLLIGIIRT